MRAVRQALPAWTALSCLVAAPLMAQGADPEPRPDAEFDPDVATLLWLIGVLVLVGIPVARQVWGMLRHGRGPFEGWRQSLLRVGLVLVAWTVALFLVRMRLQAFNDGDYPSVAEMAFLSTVSAVHLLFGILALTWLVLAFLFWRSWLLAPALFVGMMAGMLSITAGLSAWHVVSGIAASDHRVAKANEDLANLGDPVTPDEMAQIESVIQRGQFIMDSVQTRMLRRGSTTAEDLKRHLAPYGFSVRTLFAFDYRLYAEIYVAVAETGAFEDRMTALQTAGLERSGPRDFALLDDVRDLVKNNRRYRALTTPPGRSPQELYELTEARQTLSHVVRDRKAMVTNQSGKTFWILLIPLGLATWLVLSLWHLAEIRWGTGFTRRLTDRALGHLLLFHTLMPLLLVGLLGVAVMVFIGRSAPEIHTLELEEQELVTAAEREFDVIRDFVHDESRQFRRIAMDVYALEQRLVRDVSNEMRVIGSEVRSSYHAISEGIVDVEHEAVQTVKTAVGKEVDKISGMFSLDFGIFGKMDLGIGRMLKKLVPHLDLKLGDFFKGIGTQLITTMEKPFVQPLANLKALEGQIKTLARKDIDAVRAELGEITRIGEDVTALGHKLSAGRAELMRDARAMARDFGFFLMQLLWMGLAILLALAGFLVYVLVGWALSFTLRLRDSIALITRSGEA
ncbi:hypothetical protein SAMN04488012_10913 [Palleronia salina]|uniref:Uncharacterized protein n=2 Tax=Palleronia salina TaxID=313368 RepID=A0A1M6J4J3_9RHOB|nr:hypothetical protein SAMN04488012_10913 [Palleronia salina]